MYENVTYSGCDICKILPTLNSDMVVIDGVHWIANLRDNDQTLLGTTFVSLKDHVSELDKLSPAQDREFVVIRNALIQALRVSFQPLTINISCLKNNAFNIAPDETPPEAAHVHWHFKPRYGTLSAQTSAMASCSCRKCCWPPTR